MNRLNTQVNKLNFVNSAGKTVGYFQAVGDTVVGVNIDISGSSGGTGPTGPQGPTGSGIAAEGITGGTGISVTSIGTPGAESVLITNIANQYYIDKWFNPNMAIKPPGPTGIGSGSSTPIIQVITTESEIGFSVKNPDLFPFGNMLVPYINSLTLQIDAANGNPAIAALSGSTGAAYVPGGPTPIQTYILNQISNTSSYGTRVINGVTYPNSYTYGNTGLSNYIRNSEPNIGKIVVELWFDNTNVTSGTVNKVTVPLDAFLEAFPPSAPRGITGTNTNLTTSYLSWAAPQYSSYDTNTSTGSTGLPITNYKVENTYLNTPERYGTNSPFSQTTNLGNTRNLGVTGLNPGSNYSVIVSAKNSINPNYGLTGAVTYSTAKPVAPPVIVEGATGFTLPASDYRLPVQKVGGGSISATTPIYNTNNSTPKNMNSLSVPTVKVSGKTGDNLSSIELKLENISDSTTTINFNGFGASPGVTGSTGVNFVFGATGTTYDYYAGSPVNYRGFWQMGTINPSVIPSRLGATGTPYSLVSNLSYNNPATGSVGLTGGTFYADDLNVPPSISGFTFTAASLPIKPVTGIYVFGGTGGTGQYNITLNNVGTNFYRTPLTTYSLGTLGSIDSQITTKPTPDNNPSYSNQTMNLSFNPNALSVFTPITATVYNYYTPSGTNGTTGGALNHIVDGLSYSKSFLNDIPSISSVDSNTQGCRVVSYNPAILTTTSSSGWTGTARTVFDNSSDLTGGEYVNDLPIMNGSYTTRACEFNEVQSFEYLFFVNICGGTGLNVPGYTYDSLAAETSKLRYATFSWNVSNTVTNTIGNVNFQFSGFSPNNNLSLNNTTQTIVSNPLNPSDLKYVAYYRICYFNSSGVYQTPDGSPTNPSTYWLNANVASSSNFNQYSNLASNGTIGCIKTWNDNLTFPSNFTYELLTPTFTPSSLLSDGGSIRIDFVVGMKMNFNLSFSDVQCSIST